MLHGSENPGKLLCDACGQLTPHRLKFRKRNCDILQCLQCGLGSAHTADFDPASYYTEAYFDGGHDDGYSDYLGSEQVLRREFKRTLRHLTRFVGSGRLLEVGCAYGFFLLEAQDRFDVSGIEAAESAVRFCHGRGLTGVHAGLLDQQAIDQFPPMDAIVLLDVIEHLASPRDVFRILSDKLAPGGVLLLTTGDWGSVAARMLGPAWRLMTPPQHLFYFTRRSLELLGRQHGLTVESVAYPWKTVPLSLIGFQLKRMTGSTPVSTATSSRLSRVGIPVNLFDTLRIVFRKPGRRLG
jgi:SAM-dependent methyltransferase